MNRADRRKAVKNSKDRIDAFNEEGLAMMMPGGDPRQAQSLFRQVLSIDPNNAQANLRLGVMEMWAQKYPKAQEYFARAYKSDPKDPMILNNLGLCRHQQGSVPEALALYEGALEIDAENVEARINLARALLHLRNFEAALLEAKRAVAAAPHVAAAQFILGSIAQTLGDLELAKTSLQKTLDIEPGHLEASFRLCRVSYDPDDPDAWFKASQAAYDARPDDPGVALSWADILTSAGKHADVSDVLMKHITSPLPGIKVGVFNSLANAATELGDFESAIEWHKKAISADMSDPGIRLFYGRTLLRSGDYAAAQDQMRRAMEGLPFAQDLVGMLMHTQKVLGGVNGKAVQSDYESFVQTSALEPKEAWASAQELNKSLMKSLSGIDQSVVHPFDKTRRLGDKAWEAIFETTEDDAFSFLREAIQTKLHEYAHAMPEEGGEQHPMVSRRNSGMGPSRAHIETINNFEDFSYSIDQQGWFRMIYFIDVPDACGKDKAGWLRFGVPHFETNADVEPDDMAKPVAGQWIIFPAYYYFGFNALRAENGITFVSVLANSAIA
jgi:tetratricopeptide (TPR) repeat protein